MGMIKIFTSEATDFTSNGDAVIQPAKARVHKEDNGDFYLDIEANLERGKDKIPCTTACTKITGTPYFMRFLRPFHEFSSPPSCTSPNNPKDKGKAHIYRAFSYFCGMKLKAIFSLKKPVFHAPCTKFVPNLYQGTLYQPCTSFPC